MTTYLPFVSLVDLITKQVISGQVIASKRNCLQLSPIDSPREVSLVVLSHQLDRRISPIHARNSTNERSRLGAQIPRAVLCPQITLLQPASVAFHQPHRPPSFPVPSPLQPPSASPLPRPLVTGLTLIAWPFYELPWSVGSHGTRQSTMFLLQLPPHALLRAFFNHKLGP
jgi:hypothetical protein